MDVLSLKAKDLIWAKMKGFSPWPAMVVDPPETMLKVPKKNVPSRCVFFFGTNNYAWIETSNIKHYEGAYKEEFLKQGKSNAFKEAVKQIDKYQTDPSEVDAMLLPPAPVPDTDAEFNKIRDGLDSTTVAVATEESSNNDDAASLVTPKKNARAASKAKSASAKSAKSTPKTQDDVEVSTNTTKSESTKRKRNSSSGAARKRINTDFLTPSTTRRPAGAASAAASLINRPVVTRPEVPQVDMSLNPDNISTRDIVPSDKTFGFLGLGIMGGTIVKNLICTGHKVVVWNRTVEKVNQFVQSGATAKDTPSEVVEEADITFCCVSDPKVSKELVFGNCGVLDHKNWENKSYVEMSTIDPETSCDIASGIKQAGGAYLEAQIQGTREEAEEGNVVILAGGDREVFDHCHSCFKAIAKNTFFLGSDTGNACKVNLILQTLVGVSLVGLSEALSLADRFSISLKDIMDILEMTSIKSSLLTAKGKEMTKGEFNPQHPLTHMQKDLRLALDMAESVDQAMPATAVSNEVFKHAKRLGYSEHDSAAVYLRARF